MPTFVARADLAPSNVKVARMGRAAALQETERVPSLSADAQDCGRQCRLVPVELSKFVGVATE